MAGKKINELTQAANVADTDLFIVETANGTQSVPYSSIKSEGGNSNIGFVNIKRNSTAIGSPANATGGYSIAIGGQFANASGEASIAFGCTTNANGNNSIAIGKDANGNGNDSTAIGSSANANSNNSTALGHFSRTNGICSTALGFLANASGGYSTALGTNAQTSNANSIQLGDATKLSSITAKVSITTTSDERDKTDVTEIEDSALEFLNKVRAIRYVFNGRKLYIDNGNLSDEEREKLNTYGMCDYDKEAHAQGTKKGSRMRVGVSAQNIQQALIDVFGDSGYANLVNDNLFDYNPDDIPDGVESQLAVNYEGFIPFLIKAVQELDARVKELENK